jgi:transcriptional regulator with XRE-family HTH domain
MENKFMRLQEAMRQLGIDPRQLAEQTGYNQGAISKILNGQRAITHQFITIFCYKFNISESWMLDGVGEMQPLRLQARAVVDSLSDDEQQQLIQQAHKD